jgi:hypothetical protein
LESDPQARRLEALARIRARGPIKIMDPVKAIREDRAR